MNVLIEWLIGGWIDGGRNASLVGWTDCLSGRWMDEWMEVFTDWFMDS